MVKVWNFNDYRVFLNHLFIENKSQRGFVSQMAIRAGCQRSYLSQAVHGTVNLTKDQAYGISQFLNFSKLETNYFLLLVELSRCSSLEYKLKIKEELSQIKIEQSDISQKVNAKQIHDEEFQKKYYSSWQYAAIHILTSIPEFQTINSLSEKTDLSPKMVRAILVDLQKMQLVVLSKDKWKHSGTSVHIPKNSQHVVTHHRNWRDKAVMNAQSDFLERPSKSSIHYTMVQSMSKNTLIEIQQMVQNFIEESNKIAGPSPSEDLACICVDFFTF